MMKSLLKPIVMIFIAAQFSCQMEKNEPWFEQLQDDSFEQIDRLGVPYIKKMFANFPEVIAAIKTGDPSTDEEKLTPLIETAVGEIRNSLDAVSGLEALSGGASSAVEVAAVFSPNIMSVNLGESLSASNRNGRRFEEDDAFDTIFELVSGREELNDGVNEAEGLKFSASFPYLALTNTLPDEAADE